MEGIIFYWTFWFLWIYVTFILEKSNQFRFKYSMFILLTIFCSVYDIQMLGMEIGIVSLFMLGFIYTEMSSWKAPEIAYFFIIAFIVMLAFVSFQLFELYDPVWIFLKREWLMAILLSYITIMLHEDLNKRLFAFLFGSIHGEFIFTMVMKTHTFDIPVGSLGYLDTMAITVGVIVFWSGFEQLTKYFETHTHQYVKGKVKQHE